MKVYTCTNCHNPLYFENSQCLHCKRAVGFDPVTLTMITLGAGGEGGQPYRYCRNAEYGTCNWLVPAGSDAAYCLACARNGVIPALNSDENRRRWKNMEVAKHRLIYSLLRLRLPFSVKKGNQTESIVFNFMADIPYGEKVVTGHDNGVITINIEEADEAQRVRHKLDLGERYRTLLGHFRHESGHYYWDVLIKDDPALQKFRDLFGDERRDYAAALQTYYAQGAPADWNQHFISQYATAHPWEDWAETWAHYLHMMDTLETAWAFGIRIDPAELDEDAGIRATMVKEPYGIREFNRLIRRWLPLCFAVNSLNRSMGHADFYPFILSSAVIEKLQFIHERCLSFSSENAGDPA
jgi:hypothetical protein